MVVLVAILLSGAGAYAEDSPRVRVTLSEGWGYKPVSNVAKDAVLTPVTVPHTWNAAYLPDTVSYNRETMVYKRILKVTPEMEGKRLFLYFEGVNSVADVFVNRQTVAHHLGGYTAFCAEITDNVKEGENELEVWAGNAYRTDVLPISGDFNVYGGIHRPCRLVVTGKNCISPLYYASPGVFVRQKKVTEESVECEVDVLLSLKGEKDGLSVRVTISSADGNVVAAGETPADSGRVSLPLTIDNPILWDARDNPYMYTVETELYEGGALVDKVTQRTGFRYFSVDAETGFSLNGKPYDLHGFCRHEDVQGRGSALLPEDYEEDMRLIKDIGATAMRLTHYPHAKMMYDLCDESGIILWTEIPLVGPGGYNYTGYLENEGLKENARQAVRELVCQNYNHPSICFWGIFNELLMEYGKKLLPYDDPVPFVKELNGLYKRLDPTRLTTFATCVDQKYYLGCSDLIAWNKYFRWDRGDEIGSFMDNVKANSGEQPVGISEYGCGGSTLQHRCPVNEADIPLGREHPEEFQAISHEKNWSAIAERPYLWAKFIWVFADFQSVLRREGDRDGINDKGLVTYDRRTKKDAYYFYKANWNSEPMLHLCGSRFTSRSFPSTQVKAYTNMGEATLYVNGDRIGKRKVDSMNRVVWDNVRLRQGENKIEVRAGKGKEQKTESCTWILSGGLGI